MKLNALIAVALVLVLSGCNSLNIDRTYTAKSQDSRVQFLIIHYTAGGFPGSLKILTEGPVSSHYLVDENPPTIYQLVDETRRAYHAGPSYWKGATALNASSIGIEIINRGYAETKEGRTYFDFPQPQIDAVLALTKQIVAEHKILPERVIGHSDIAPGRKPDPGPRFPWKQLAKEGLILWPNEAEVATRMPAFTALVPDVAWFQANLAKHGFQVPNHGMLDAATRSVIAAFQMKYRPSNFDGTPDAETGAMLDVLVSPKAPSK